MREAFYRTLTEEESKNQNWNWRGMWARPAQLAPPGKWTYWLLLAGRGFGKTRTGGEWIRENSERYPRMHLVAPTAADARDVMLEGESGLMSLFPPWDRPTYEPSKRLVRFRNGSQAYLFSAEEPERLRGPQCYAFWADELAAWKYADETWDNLMFGFRLGEDPRGIITTTPRPIKRIRDLIAEPHCITTRGTSYDNRAHLSPAFFASIVQRYEGTRLGRQELLAELLEDVPGALWTRAKIEANRIKPDAGGSYPIQWDKIERIVVGVDPAVTNRESSDETGIIVCALTLSHHVLVLADRSLRASTDAWARAVIDAYRYFKADRVIGEVNQGGDLIEASLRTIDPSVAFKAVRATRGKAIRAEPVAALYEQNRVHHAGPGLDMLEDQLCTWSPQADVWSPDRLDALVWAITELLIDNTPGVGTLQLANPYVIG